MSRLIQPRGGLAAAAALAGWGLLLAAPRPASAANEAHPRTPVVWPQSCAQIVVRSEDPVAQLDYEIPMEDTQLEADELPDSRTHQFIALCRQHPASELLPAWITRDDVERSVTAGLIEPDSVMAREILDESSVWSGCFSRITPDDARSPIDDASAAAGVTWDTSALVPGVWSVSGYTFEPPFPLWSDRPGFVKVVDTREDPEQDLPALALLNREQLSIEVGARIEIEACADVLEPAEIVFEWATFAPFLDWRELHTHTLNEDGSFTPDLRVPAEAAAQVIVLRARVTDAMGREYVAHAPARLAVSECPPEGCPDDAQEGGDEGANPVTAGGCSLSTRPDSIPAKLAFAFLFALLGYPRWNNARAALRQKCD